MHRQAMNHERITIDPDVMFGKPVIEGMRIPVERVLRKLAAGHSPEQIHAATALRRRLYGARGHHPC